MEDNTELLITMTVKENDKSSKGLLILKLPTHDTSEKSLKFQKEFYVAVYPKIETKIIQFDVPIAFKDLDYTKGMEIIVKGKMKTIIHLIN